MLLYATTLFLPSPAVPYVRLSLFIATRWKPLPPRHLCDTQAHLLILVAPAPRGPLLREVMLSIPIIAPTASSASLTNSSRFQISTLIRKVFVIQGEFLTVHQTFPNLLHASFDTCRHPYPGGPFRCVCLLLHEMYQSSPTT